MDKVPTMISTKDLSYISDMFEWNFTLSKKINHYIGEVTDEEIKSVFEELRNIHSEICNTLVQILSKGE